MIIRKAYRYRLKPNAIIEQILARAAGCCRLIWNKALELQLKRLEVKERTFYYGEMCRQLILWKQNTDFSFLNETHSQPLQQVLKDLDRAFSDYFDRKKGVPKFKKKGVHDALRYPQGCRVERNCVFLPKIGWVPFFQSSPVQGTIKNVTVSRKGAHWFVSIQTEQECAQPIHPSSSTVGIDRGVCRFATLSNGVIYESLNSFRRKERKLVVAQRKLSRQVKFSNNWKKQKKQIGRIHIDIAHARQDYLHKMSTEISKNHAVIVLEDLDVKKMTQSTFENESKKRNCSALNKSILDQGWSEFQRQLEYKQEWRGGKVIKIPPQYTSQTCPSCQHVASENRKSQSQFKCVQCGHEGHADFVAARNILAVGQTVSACRSNLVRGRKQEPVGNCDEILLLA